MRHLTGWTLALASVLTAVLVPLGLARGAVDAQFPFPPGTVIQLVVPWGPGGGFDVIARLVQPSLQEALATLGGQRINVIVVNRPGAGAQVGAEYVYNAPPDGTQLVLLDSESAPLQENYLGAKFHVADFTYVGRVNVSNWGIIVRTNLGIQSMKELIARAQHTPILVGTSGAGGGDHIAWRVIQAILKDHGTTFPLNFVHFSSTPTVFASMQRNEAEAGMGSLESLLPATDAGYAKLIVQFDNTRNMYYQTVPTIFQEQIPGAQTITALCGTTRVFAGPPNIPADRLAVLSRALKMALADPLLARRAKDARTPLDYGTAAEARQVMVVRGKTLDEYRDVVNGALRGTGSK